MIFSSLDRPFAESLTLQLQTRIYALPVLLGFGIGLYFIWPHEPGLARPLFGTLFLLTLTAWLLQRGDHTWRLLVITALMLVTAGFTAATFRSLRVSAPMITESLGPVGIEGRIKSLEQLEGGVGIRILLDELVIDDVRAEKTPHALRLSIRKGGHQIKTGMRVRVFAKIEPASPPTTPGGFDFLRHAYFQQIGGYGYVLGDPKILALDQPTTETLFQGRFERARNHITALVNKTLEPRQAGMTAALMTGERAAINKEDWQALRDSGLAHLLAISGANVDMVALIVFFVVRLGLALFPRVALAYPIKKWAAGAAFLAALAYVLLIAPSTPTWRAMVTITLVLTAILIDRSPISLRLVAASAFLILLIQPEQLLSPSFQLSFAAVTALVAVFEMIAPWLKRIHGDAGAVKRALMYLVGVCATTIIATIATAPISLYHFQTLALYGVIANALAVPIMTFLIMPLAILCYPLIALGVAGPVLHVIGAACDWILAIAHMTADLPGARLTPPALPLSSFLAIICAGLILCLGARWIKIFSVIPLIIAMLILSVHTRPDTVILQGGKVILHRTETGEIITNTRRFARRAQADWVRYWGGDELKGARVDKTLTVPSFENVGVPLPRAPLAIYSSPRAKIMTIGPRVTGRRWNNHEASP